MKELMLTTLFCLLVVTLFGCSEYDERDFIGKTSAEIVSEYGEFDCITMPISEDGLYRNCQCGYTVKEPKVGFFGTSPEELFFISFDSDGIAVSTEIDFRPGG